MRYTNKLELKRTELDYSNNCKITRHILVSFIVTFNLMEHFNCRYHFHVEAAVHGLSFPRCSFFPLLKLIRQTYSHVTNMTERTTHNTKTINSISNNLHIFLFVHCAVWYEGHLHPPLNNVSFLVTNYSQETFPLLFVQRGVLI